MKHQSSRALWIASWIRDADFTIVYLDEFRYSAHEDRFYGWWSKASNLVYWANPQTFNMSFWVMMSEDCIIAIKGTANTFDSKLFVQFLEEAIVYLPDKVVLWMDNSSIHKTLDVHKTLKRHNILALTIPPYSPWLNPWEHLIRSIKTIIRKIQGTEKLITLRTIKQVVDKVNQEELRKYLEMSIKETLRFINSETS